MIRFNFLFCLLCYTLCFSQTKNEKEVRIKSDAFPELAQSYFNISAFNAKQLRFYKETDNEKQSFEAKFKINKLHYSVEFDSLGGLEDIEILIKKKHIPEAVFDTITSYFNSNFDKTKIIKIQKQYINNTEKSDKNFIKHIIENPNNTNTHFEIIAEIKTKNKHELREFTFNSHGTFQKFRLVTSSSYEHALY